MSVSILDTSSKIAESLHLRLKSINKKLKRQTMVPATIFVPIYLTEMRKDTAKPLKKIHSKTAKSL